MAFVHILSTLFCATILLTLFVGETSGGECCHDYTDILGWHSGRWCDTYCCGIPNVGGLSCCTDLALRASDPYRSRFCGHWFIYPHHIWIPIVIGVIVLVLLALCCFCCITCWVL